MGNQARRRLLAAGVVQPKLTVNQPGDPVEHEADLAAEAVMRMPDPVTTRPTSKSQPALVRRMCSDCEEELHRKAGPAAETVAADFQHPRSDGQPLPDSERRFFEPRFSRDFAQVRVHVGGEATAAARSVNALAYTMGTEIVFGERQYRPGTDSGRRLLAHEIAHVAQQGSGNTPSLQRLGDPSQAPAMGCPIAKTSAAFVDTNILFSLGASSATPTAIADIASFIARWNAAGGSKAVRVDGFASTDGPEPLNWTLSCDRASMVEAELMTPASGAPGIPASFIETFAQGETSEFGSALAMNRCATISADIAAPPPPARAHPGDSRTLDLQPVFMRTDPTDAAPTGASWSRRFAEANAIWGKIGVTFVELSPVTIDKPLKTTGSTIPEIRAIMALRSGPGIEVFLADNDLGGGRGGGGTVTGCGGAGKIVISDRGTSDTLLAHELAHTMFDTVAHPPAAGDPGTIAQPSGSHSVANPTRNTLGNYARIVCPAPSGSTCLNPDP